MTDLSARLDLPLIKPSQAQKHVTHNEALQMLDALVQSVVEETGATTPPADPFAGQLFALGAAPTGDWAGESDKLALRVTEGWVFLTPREGWRVWDRAAGRYKVFDGSTWNDVGMDLDNLDGVGIATVSDAVNRLAVSSQSSLFTGDGAGHQVKVNKTAAGDTATLLFQSGYSGRAEFGLAGDDNLHVKVSPDGNGWHEALVVDRGNGFVGVGAAPGEAPFETTHSQGSPTTNHARFVNPSTSNSAQVRTSLQRGNDQGSGLARGGVWFVTDQGLGFADYEARDLKFYTGETPGGATARIIVKPDGKVGVGKEPSTALDVDGPARVKSYTVATAPSASSAGEGAIIFVSDEAGGAVLAFSDGTDWRRVTDRAVIS